MDNAKQQILDRLKQANNILVTVSANPSVDQLSACIGLTLLLNKFGKHGTAVFSGEVPSTIEFLEPEKTIEKTTDSLRDFIIALDKTKADKLRYKVEDKVVRIFITPYRTSITEKDLEFSQGDFNVEMIIALGVREQQELDQAITSHGRILHDATVVSVNNGPGGNLGTIHWQDAAASSLAEMVASLSDELDKNLLDNQIATALLTGIVAETNRFSNDKTTPVTMSLSAALMAAGANQQLVASKLQTSETSPVGKETPSGEGAPASSTDQLPELPKPDNGALEINHEDVQDTAATPPPPASEEALASSEHQIHVDQEGRLSKLQENKDAHEPQQQSSSSSVQPPTTAQSPSQHLVMQPPSLSGTLTANSKPEGLDPSIDPLSVHSSQPLLRRDSPSTVSPSTTVSNPPSMPTTPVTDNSSSSLQPQPTVILPDRDNTSNDQKPPTPSEEVQSAPSPEIATADDVDKARSAVAEAINTAPNQEVLPPIQALGSQPLYDVQATQNNTLSGNELSPSPSNSAGEQSTPPPGPTMPLPPSSPISQPPTSAVDQLETLSMPPPPTTFPPNLVPPSSVNPNPQTDANAGSSTPPPVPPPMMPFPPANNPPK